MDDDLRNRMTAAVTLQRPRALGRALLEKIFPTFSDADAG